ncbi:hypothetical protein [Kitasatospora sp. GP82]|uniref:hypothetical protein n=1 Tax=Kitasatospora sp. GP82 TaxID=3035089 RepID=UPI002477149C|nr:hypothetical protein [Kitasatospora sp. GP82]
MALTTSTRAASFPVDPLHYDRSYYLGVAAPGGERPYALLREALVFPNKTYRGSIRQTRCLVAAIR